jgi:hypothetical protein
MPHQILECCVTVSFQNDIQVNICFSGKCFHYIAQAISSAWEQEVFLSDFTEGQRVFPRQSRVGWPNQEEILLNQRPCPQGMGDARVIQNSKIDLALM